MIGCCGANLESLRFAFGRLGVEIEITDDPERLARASHVILPGVGAAKTAMSRLDQAGLTPLIPTLAMPVLGICVGMQLLFRHSAEEDTACLGIVDAVVERLPETSGLPIPEMGWNQIEIARPCPLTEGIESGGFAYFVHSYAAPPGPYTAAVTEYGVPFTSIVAQGNFYGTQFHPERSSTLGAQILANFLRMP